MSRDDYFRFSSIFIKKKNKQTEFFLKKPKPGQTDRFRFGFLGKKPVWLGFGLVFPGFGLVFSVWLGFFSGFGSVFSFFCL
jgi:hypothetical protein